MADGPERDERTEEPTQRRLDEAIERGDVAKSPELATFLALGATTLALTVVAGPASRTLALDMRAFLANPHLVPDDPAALLFAAKRAAVMGLTAAAAPVGLIVLAALAAGLLQHRLLWTVEPMMPKFERISPGAGLGRIFGRQSLANFVKSILKIGFIGTPAAFVLWNERDRLERLVGVSASGLTDVVLTLSIKLLGAILMAHAILAIGDYAWARYSWLGRQRMTKEELKQETKEQDGNPEIKAKIRQIRSQRLRKRMMAAVPKATVIITNPTHYAVALRYERGMPAPICVAKGIDELAKRIRVVAGEHDVPVIENPPLARALHATVEIDSEIPVEHYKAVAEVIGFVLRLRRRAS